MRLQKPFNQDELDIKMLKQCSTDFIPMVFTIWDANLHVTTCGEYHSPKSHLKMIDYRTRYEVSNLAAATNMPTMI